MLFYVFETEAEATAAVEQINLIGNAPIPGRSAATGEVVAEKGVTKSWAQPWQRITDGKWVFAKVPTEMISSAGQEAEDAFNAAFNYVFEEYDQSWRVAVD